MVSAAVCFEAAVAAILVAAGMSVVLCGPDGAGLARAGAVLPGAGRVAVFVGDPADESVVASALAMAGELFGKEAVVVRSADEAARVSRQSGLGWGSVEALGK